MSKTVYVCFTRDPNKKFHSIYYVGAQPIVEKKEVRDLGIIFYAKLNFEAHVNMLETRTRCMHGAAYRFSNEIHNQHIVLKIVQIYICPIVEYGSIIWRRQIQKQDKKMEASQRFATRLALGLPFSTRDPRYKPYDERLSLCGIISMENRAQIARAIFVCRCIRQEMISTVADIIRNRRILRTRTRSPLLFQTGDLSIGGPLRIMLTTANELRIYFNLNDSIQTTGRNLKNYFIENAHEL